MKPSSPNILFVLTDDQGYGDIGCHGNPIVKTPHLDQFHDESVRFTNFHVGPTCAPTRSGLLTGHYANSTGVWHTVGGRSLLRANEITIANVFKENGYRTGLFGKWHLGDNYPYRPQDRGFDQVVCHGGGGISQAPDCWGNDYFDDHYFVNGVATPFTGYCTDVFFSEAMDFIEKNKDEPFVCFLPTNAPHSPYNVEEQYSAPYKGLVSTEDRANFYGMITNVDENFGRLLSKLDELDIRDKTIIIFMTDNGSSLGDDEAYTAGLRGFKNSEYDGGHRVPFFVQWNEGGIHAPRDIDQLTANVDFMPTLMELAGIDLEAYAHCQFHGESLAPLLKDPGAIWKDRIVVTDSQRLTNPIKWRKSAVMTEQWRLINGKELYDINADRSQQRDLAAKFPDVVVDLRQGYDTWWELVSQQFSEEIPISIGSCDELVTRLSSHDWRHPNNPQHHNPEVDESNDHLAYCQGQVRHGQGENGYFEIRVEESGNYRFELCRWPKEENRAIVEGIAASQDDFRADVIQEKNHHVWMGGKAMPFTQASILIGEHASSQPISAHDKSVVFELNLQAGDTHLRTAFTTDEGLERGAYYVYVSKASDTELSIHQQDQ